MKRVRFTVKASDKRNEMHFEVQRKMRSHVFRNRKAYNRKDFKLANYTD